jgi:hypothetical protein
MVNLFNPNQKATPMKKSLIIAGLLALTYLLGCKKTVEPQPVVSTTGNLYFHFHTLSDTAEFLPGNIVADSTGRKYKYSAAQLYISDINLIKLDGTALPVNNVSLLINPAQESYFVGAVPVGNYKSVAFNIGVDTAHNHKDPSIYPAGNALAAQSPSMHFTNNTQGYIFVNIAGFVDTTAAKNGPLNQAFNYQIGIDSLLKHKIMPDMPYSILPDQTQFVHMYADYSKLFRNINLKTENAGANGDAVAQKVAKNISSIIRYE